MILTINLTLLIKESKKIAAEEKKGMQSGIRVEFFSKIVKQTGSNNCKQGGKNFKIVK